MKKPLTGPSDNTKFMNNDITQLNRGNGTIQNVLRMLRPILEEQGIIGTRIKATQLAKICRNHHRRLPVRSYCAKELAEEINSIPKCGGGLFVFDDLEIQVYDETDFETRRRSPSIEFQRLVSLERQYLDSKQQQAQETKQ